MGWGEKEKSGAVGQAPGPTGRGAERAIARGRRSAGEGGKGELRWPDPLQPRRGARADALAAQLSCAGAQKCKKTNGKSGRLGRGARHRGESQGLERAGRRGGRGGTHLARCGVAERRHQHHPVAPQQLRNRLAVHLSARPRGEKGRRGRGARAGGWRFGRAGERGEGRVRAVGGLGGQAAEVGGRGRGRASWRVGAGGARATKGRAGARESGEEQGGRGEARRPPCALRPSSRNRRRRARRLVAR